MGRGRGRGSPFSCPLFHSLPDLEDAVSCVMCGTGHHALPLGLRLEEQDACWHTVGASSQCADQLGDGVPPRGASGQDAAPVTATEREALQPAFRRRANQTRPQGSRAPGCPGGRQLGVVTSSQSPGMAVRPASVPVCGRRLCRPLPPRAGRSRNLAGLESASGFFCWLFVYILVKKRKDVDILHSVRCPSCGWEQEWTRSS